MHETRWSRRQFLSLATVGAVGTVAVAGCGGPAPEPKGSHGDATFRSRPDLTPTRIAVTGPAGVPANGYVFANPGGPMIVDDGGSPVWFRKVGNATTNLQVQQYEGNPVLTWWEGQIVLPEGYGEGECVIMDSNYREIRRIRAKNGLRADAHEFLLTPEGIAYFTCYPESTGDLSAVQGPSRAKFLDTSVQGIDLTTGEVVFEWRSARHVDIAESYATYSNDAVFDPVHLNSIKVMSDGNLLLSARNTWALYKVDRRTGDIIWRLGGKRSDFDLGPGVRFAWQHDAQVHPGDLYTLFDDEADPPEASQSRALVLHVDESAMKATLVRAYVHPGKKLLAGSQGSVQILENGDVFVGWGAEPYYTEFRQTGELVLDGHFLDGMSYRAYRFPWTGTPTELPAIAVERRAHGHLRAYASWNGSTEVRHWQVLAGSARQSLSPAGSSPKAGFETAIDVRGPAPLGFVAVQALDADGNVLATSRTTRA